MKQNTLRILWGVLLIVGGILFLLENMNVIHFSGFFIAALFAFGGLTFLGVFFYNRQHWWALIPGFVLLAIGMTIALRELSPSAADTLGGGIFLGSIGLAFFVVYLFNQENWWAVIPGGVLLTLGAVSTMGEVGIDTGGIFFLGLGLTFLLLGMLPTPHGRMRWAFIPAGILLTISLLVLAAFGNLINIVVPVALILVGLFLLVRTFLPARRV